MLPRRHEDLKSEEVKIFSHELTRINKREYRRINRTEDNKESEESEESEEEKDGFLPPQE